MVLHYKFEYHSNNNTLVHYLKNSTNNYAVEFKMTRENDTINFYVKGELDELEKLSTHLSSYVPMSIFFKNITVDAVDEMPLESIEVPNGSGLLTFCTSCMNKIEDKTAPSFYNPFIACSNCGQELDIEDFGLYNGMEKIEKSNNVEYFETVAKHLNDGKKIKISTLSGDFVFAKLESIKDCHQDRLKLLCTNLTNIAEVCIASKSEVIALASVEKPSIDLKTNEIFKGRNILNKTTLNVRYANDLILYLLSKELEKYNINFLYYLDVAQYDFALSFKTKNSFKLINIPKVAILDNQDTLLLENKNYEPNLDVVYDKFDDKNKSQFMVLLTENKLYNKSILNFYSSGLHHDCISLYSEDIGMLDILNYKIPNSIKDIFDVIKEDEVGAKLIANYEEKFPAVYKSALCFNMSSVDKNSIFSLWKIVSMVLGFESSVLENANNAILDKGPRIDYKYKSRDDIIYNKEFNIYMLIRSGMSYRLAGVDDRTICLGYVESYAHYISSMVDTVNESFTIDGVSLCGDLFADKVISHFVQKSITKNFKIYYNKDFAIQKD